MKWLTNPNNTPSKLKIIKSVMKLLLKSH